MRCFIWLFICFFAVVNGKFLKLGEVYRIHADTEAVVCFDRSVCDWSFTDQLFSTVNMELEAADGKEPPFAMAKTERTPPCSKPNLIDSLHHLSLSITNRNNTLHLPKMKKTCYIICPSSANRGDVIAVTIKLAPFNMLNIVVITVSMLSVALAPFIANFKLFYYIIGALCGFGSFTILMFKIFHSIRKIGKFRIELFFVACGMFSVLVVELLQHLYKLIIVASLLSISLGASLAYLFADKLITTRTIRVAIFNIQLLGILLLYFSTDCLTILIPIVSFLLLVSFCFPIKPPSSDSSTTVETPVSNQEVIPTNSKFQLIPTSTPTSTTSEERLCPTCYKIILNLLSKLVQPPLEPAIIINEFIVEETEEETPLNLSLH